MVDNELWVLKDDRRNRLEINVEEHGYLWMWVMDSAHPNVAIFRSLLSGAKKGLMLSRFERDQNNGG